MRPDEFYDPGVARNVERLALLTFLFFLLQRNSVTSLLLFGEELLDRSSPLGSAGDM